MKNFYTLTVPVFIRSFDHLLAIVEKGEAFAKPKKISEKKMLDARLAPDMYTLTQQVQYAYFTALDATTGLTGTQSPVFAYDEGSFAELKKSVRRTISFLKTIKPKDFTTASKRKVPAYFNPERKVPAEKYILTLALPNFFFHLTTAYAILRHLGVPLKKADYLGKF